MFTSIGNIPRTNLSDIGFSGICRAIFSKVSWPWPYLYLPDPPFGCLNPASEGGKFFLGDTIASKKNYSSLFKKWFNQNQFSECMELLVTKINQVRLADEATLTGCGYIICDKMIIHVKEIICDSTFVKHFKWE